MKIIIPFTLAIVFLIVSCQKDKKDPVVNQNNVRVYTESSYYDNGNLASLTRYGYYENGMIKSVVSFHVVNSAPVDTVNVTRFHIDYLMPDDSTVLQITYNSNQNQTYNRDTTTLKLDNNGLYKELWKIKKYNDWNIGYQLQKGSFDEEGNHVAQYSISYHYCPTKILTYTD